MTTPAKPAPTAADEIDLSKLTCIHDYEREALRTLNAGAAAYLFGGAADEITIGRNRNAFTHLEMLPRILRRASGGSAGTRFDLLGSTLAHPIIVAPVAYQKLAHPQGEIATAMGAAAQGALMVLSSQSSIAMEQVHAAGPACRWFQLYFQRSRAATLALVRRAEKVGFKALVVTVDAPVCGVRNAEQRAAFRLPANIGPVNLEGLPAGPMIELDEGASLILDGLMATAPNWSDVEWLQSQTTLPVVLKGILAPDDAVIAADTGVAAIIVSNHGGRTLDTAVPPILALPRIADRLGGRLPLLLDGGVRRGTDAVKALALGARAVLVGRPVVAGLAVGGARGVSHVLRILRDEFEIAMALCGCAGLQDIGPHLIERTKVP